MSGYIEKESAEIVIKKLISSSCSPFDKQDALDELNSIPSANVEPVRHGHWIPIRRRMYACGEICTVGYICSECRHEEDYEAPYCNCGAKMDGKEKNENGTIR